MLLSMNCDTKLRVIRIMCQKDQQESFGIL